MKSTRSLGILAFVAMSIAPAIASSPASAQQLIDDWIARTTATPDALVSGPAAVFRNPAQLAPLRRAEALVMDMRGPDITGISGVAAAAAYRLDGRTSVAVGYQHVGLDGIELTDDTPDESVQVSIGQDLIGAGVSRMVSDRLQFGAGAQYLRASDFLNAESVLRLLVGAQWRLPVALPVTVAASALNQDDNTSWTAAARVAPSLRSAEWTTAASYGAASGHMTSGVTHRATAEVGWRNAVNLQLGAVAEPGSDGHSVSPIGSLAVRVNRYEVGVVRESLSNDFGAVHTFRIGVVF